MFKNNGEIKILSHKGKLKECIINRPILQTNKQTKERYSCWKEMIPNGNTNPYKEEMLW